MINQTEQAQLYVQLLVGSGLVNRREFADFKKLAKDLNIPLIQAIMNSGTIPKESLNKTMEALTRVQSKQISPDLAIRALRVALKKNIGMAEAINEAKNLHRTTRTVVTATNELSNLLLDAQVLKREQFGPLLVKSHESSIMIGQVLIIEGIVSVNGLLSALNALILIKESGLDRQVAIAALKRAYEKLMTIEQALFEMGRFVKPDARLVRIGELFLMAEVISLEEFAECLEIEIFKEKDFDHILLERGLINAETRSCAESLLEAVAGELVKPFEAANALKLVVGKELGMRDAINEIVKSRTVQDNFMLGDLLVDAGLCERLALENTLKENQNSAIKVGSILMKSKLIEEKYLYSALRLQTALRQGFLCRETTVDLLDYCFKNKISLDLAFSKRSIFVPSRMQWSWV